MLTQEWLVCECLFSRRVGADTSFLFLKPKDTKSTKCEMGSPPRLNKQPVGKLNAHWTQVGICEPNTAGYPLLNPN